MAHDGCLFTRQRKTAFHPERPPGGGHQMSAQRPNAELAAVVGFGSRLAVVLEAGHDSVSAFIHAFRRDLGVTPGRYFAANE